MSAPARELEVWLDAERIGRLSERGNLWQFAYDATWDGGDLSPALPRSQGTIVDGASQRPVQWFFGNLLPEEGVRGLLAQDAQLDAADSFGLLAWYGRESAGALTLLPPGEVASSTGMTSLSDDALSRRIRNLPRLPLTHGAANACRWPALSTSWPSSSRTAHCSSRAVLRHPAISSSRIIRSRMRIGTPLSMSGS